MAFPVPSNSRQDITTLIMPDINGAVISWGYQSNKALSPTSGRLQGVTLNLNQAADADLTFQFYVANTSVGSAVVATGQTKAVWSTTTTAWKTYSPITADVSTLQVALTGGVTALAGLVGTATVYMNSAQ